jgi:DNA-binding transcriptional LysR family regulator
MLGSLRDIDLKLIRAFIAVAECGGFMPAQAVLNIGPSRLSTMIAELEERLGLTLCRRGRVGFALTESGQEVYRAAQRLVADLEAFRSSVGSLRGKLIGNLAIGMVDNIVSNPEQRIAEVINRFTARAQEVRITIHIDGPQELERKVLDGRLDIGIGAFHHALPGLGYHALFLEEQTLYCGRDHPLFARPAEEIGRADLLSASYAGRDYLEDLRPLNLFAVANSYSMEGLALLVLSGRFIAYLPSHYAAAWVAKGEMRPLLAETLSYQSLFEVVVRQGHSRSPLLQAFLEDLHAGHAKRLLETRGAKRAMRGRKRGRARPAP